MALLASPPGRQPERVFTRIFDIRIVASSSISPILPKAGWYSTNIATSVWRGPSLATSSEPSSSGNSALGPVADHTTGMFARHRVETANPRYPGTGLAAQ